MNRQDRPASRQAQTPRRASLPSCGLRAAPSALRLREFDDGYSVTQAERLESNGGYAAQSAIPGGGSSPGNPTRLSADGGIDFHTGGRFSGPSYIFPKNSELQTAKMLRIYDAGRQSQANATPAQLGARTHKSSFLSVALFQVRFASDRGRNAEIAEVRVAPRADFERT